MTFSHGTSLTFNTIEMPINEAAPAFYRDGLNISNFHCYQV